VIAAGARVEKSVLSPGVSVGPGAVIRYSVILTDTAIEANARLAQAERGRIRERINLIEQAQAAERAALELHQEHDQSVFERMAAGVQALIDSVPDGIALPDNWFSAINAFNSVLIQLNHLYGLPPPAIFMPAPAHAMGTPSFGGGLTWVGERGRELVNLPRGSRIFANGESERMAANGGAGGAHYHLHLTTSAPTVNLVQEFSMLQASAGVS